MKKLMLVICCATSLAVSIPVSAQKNAMLVETSTHSVFKGLFKSVWVHLRSINPSQTESARSVTVYAAGIRGAESTDTLFKPYWKDDLIQNGAFQAELQKYSVAQIELDQGELENAIQLFDSFLSEFGNSSLRPNALFGKGLSQAGLGQGKSSLATMQQFVDENPNHPLLTDAKQIITEVN